MYARVHPLTRSHTRMNTKEQRKFPVAFEHTKDRSEPTKYAEKPIANADSSCLHLLVSCCEPVVHITCWKVHIRWSWQPIISSKNLRLMVHLCEICKCRTCAGLQFQLLKFQCTQTLTHEHNSRVSEQSTFKIGNKYSQRTIDGDTMPHRDLKTRFSRNEDGLTIDP